MCDQVAALVRGEHAVGVSDLEQHRRGRQAQRVGRAGGVGVAHHVAFEPLHEFCEGHNELTVGS